MDLESAVRGKRGRREHTEPRLATALLGMAVAFVGSSCVLGSSWPKHLPSLQDFPGGDRFQRTLIHVHSVLSHDACDGMPRDDRGESNVACVDRLIRALCDHHVDAVFLTEHRRHLAEVPFSVFFESARPVDSVLLDKKRPAGLARRCADGSSVPVYFGAENALMPIGMERHPATSPGGGLESSYDDRSPEAAEVFRQTGALVAVSHTEEAWKTDAVLAALQPDAVEIYNLHTELKLLEEHPDPELAASARRRIQRFLVDDSLEPDLVLLSILSRNTSSLRKWSALSLRQQVTGIAGTDAHENYLPGVIMPDGERVDSYRRLFRWFSNYVEARHPDRKSDLLESIRRGRVFVVFELFGIPDLRDLSFRAVSGKREISMGERLDRTGHSTEFQLRIPRLAWPRLEDGPGVPVIRGRILQATETGWREVATHTIDQRVLTYRTDQGGAYRAEIIIEPNHLETFLPGMEEVIRPMVWIYTNPIWIGSVTTGVDR